MLDAQVNKEIDWIDIKVSIAVGIISGFGKIFFYLKPEYGLGHLAVIPFLICFTYIICRARHQPEKLDEWGLTTPITLYAMMMGLFILGGLVVFTALMGYALAGELSFEFEYVKRMIQYIIDAFPQQFFLCSVILVSLNKLKKFSGQWRLPLRLELHI